MSKSQEILKEMAQLTLLTGRISEVHLKNMQNFPFVFFNAVQSAEIDYNIAVKKDEESLITYKLEMPLGMNENLEHRYKSLAVSIKTLFWKEVKTAIEINGEAVYKSE